MLNISTAITYPVLIILSTAKKSFENLGLLIQCSGNKVKRLLNPVSTSFELSRGIAQSIFAGEKNLSVVIDDTLIKKIYSNLMQGAGSFFDTKIGRRITAFRLVIGMVSNGKHAIPIECAYLFSKEILDSIDNQNFPTKEEIAKLIVETAIKLFPNAKLTVIVDGLYSTISFVKWCNSKKIRLEARMHSNRVIHYKGEPIKIRDLLLEKNLKPKGRQMARTIPVIWHDMNLELTIVRRIDKNDNESFVFQIATYSALPREHLANYKKRWPIEMIIRTAKQSLGIQECFSRDLETQHKHVASVLLAYALAQLEMKNSKLETPEQAVRRSKTKNVDFLTRRFTRFLNKIPYFDA